MLIGSNNCAMISLTLMCGRWMTRLGFSPYWVIVVDQLDW
jgi:hypothetical protein